MACMLAACSKRRPPRNQAPGDRRPAHAAPSKRRPTKHQAPGVRGVRRRGRVGGRCRWVCEVRVPGSGGCRLWLGTYGAAEAAARRLNFADSAWLLDVPAHAALRRAEGGVLRRAMVRAVEEYIISYFRTLLLFFKKNV